MIIGFISVAHVTNYPSSPVTMHFKGDWMFDMGFQVVLISQELTASICLEQNYIC